MFKKLERYLRSPYYALGDDLSKTHPEWMSDRYFIRVFWHQMFGYPLDLKHPATFNEKIQWMKLYDHDPRYPDLIDKYKVKEWVKRVIGEQYVIPTLAVYDTPDDITLEGLPDQFVLKCNHGSGMNIIVRDKADSSSAGTRLPSTWRRPGRSCGRASTTISSMNTGSGRTR